MATFLKYSLLLSLSLILALQIQAREVKESHFFNKFTRENPVNIPETVAAVKTQETIPKQEDPIDFATKHSSKGHGLYGDNENNNEDFYDQNQNYHSTFNYEKNNNNNNDNFNKNLNAKYSSNEYSQEKDNNNNFNNFNAKYSSNKYNQEMNYNPRENNFDAKDSQAAPEFVDRPYGMSDTRFLENGKYFYDINAKKRNSRNENFESARGNNMGYYGSSKNWYNNNNNNKNYYNNNVDGDEFDDAMNRYRNRGEEAEEEYEP